MAKLVTSSAIPAFILMVTIPFLLVMYLYTMDYDSYKRLVPAFDMKSIALNIDKGTKRLLPWLEEDGGSAMLDQLFANSSSESSSKEVQEVDKDTMAWMCQAVEEIKVPASKLARSTRIFCTISTLT